MSKFIKWWLEFCLIVGGAYTAYSYGLLTMVFDNDVTKLSYIIIGLFGIYRMAIRQVIENPDNTFTPLPRNITPLGIELDPETGVDLSNKENKN